MANCKRCKGTGAVKCPDCNGRGKKEVGLLSVIYIECKHCHGSGEKQCGVCDGKGTV
jgi:DnaJ-class molecular chaperone